MLCYLIKLCSSIKTAPQHCTLVINTNASILCVFQPFSKRTCIIEGPAYPKTGCTRYCNITIKVHSYSSLRLNVHRSFPKGCLAHHDLSFRVEIHMLIDVHALSISNLLQVDESKIPGNFLPVSIPLPAITPLYNSCIH